MTKMNSFVLRSVFSLILGLVLILWPEKSIIYLVIIVGVLFIIPGFIAMISYWGGDRATESKKRFPIEGVGSVLLGLCLTIYPSFFVHILMYLLGFILLLGAIQQLSVLLTARKKVHVPFGFFVIPLSVLISGIVVLFNPFTIASVSLILLGSACVVYSISELINGLRYKK